MTSLKEACPICEYMRSKEVEEFLTTSSLKDFSE